MIASKPDPAPGWTAAYPNSVSAGLRMIADSIKHWGHYSGLGNKTIQNLFTNPDVTGKCCLLYNPVFGAPKRSYEMTDRIEAAISKKIGSSGIIAWNDTHTSKEVISMLVELADELEEKNG